MDLIGQGLAEYVFNLLSGEYRRRQVEGNSVSSSDEQCSLIIGEQEFGKVVALRSRTLVEPKSNPSK